MSMEFSMEEDISDVGYCFLSNFWLSRNVKGWKLPITKGYIQYLGRDIESDV